VGEISTHQKQGMESSTIDVWTKNSQSPAAKVKCVWPF